MSGRFFAMPFLVSVLMLSHILRDFAYQPMLTAGLVACNILLPLAPVKVTPNYDAGWAWRNQNGVRDEHGHTHKLTSMLAYSPFRDLPDHTWVREGLSFRNGPDKVTVQGSIGWYGLAAGPDKYLIDRNALSEPLLARLPVSPGSTSSSTGAFLSRHPRWLRRDRRDTPEPDRRSRDSRVLRSSADATARAARQQCALQEHLALEPRRRTAVCAGGTNSAA